MKRRYELTDEQWLRVARLLPPERGRKARPARNNRRMVNAMVWIARSGAPWRDLPAYYPSWKSVYTRFSRWSQQGIWQHVLAELAKDASDDMYQIDATIVRAHQDAHGAKKGAAKRSASRAEDRPRRYTLWWTPKDALFASP
jgi:transposase